MDKTVFVSGFLGLVRLGLGVGGGALLAKHGVTDMQGVLTVAGLMATGLWSLWSHSFDLARDVGALVKAFQEGKGETK